MNNLIVVPDICQLRSLLTYTIHQSISKEPPLSNELPSSWENFAAMSAQQPEAKSIKTDIIAPTQKSTIAAPRVLKPTPLPEDYDAMVESFLHFLDTLDTEVERADDLTVE